MARRLPTEPPIVRRRDGFTLIELFVVVGLIGILAAIAIQSFSSYRQRAHDARAMHDLGNAITAEEAYFASNFSYKEVPSVLGPATIDSPEFVVSAGVTLEITLEGDGFEVTAKSAFGTGTIYKFDSATGVITKQ